MKHLSWKCWSSVTVTVVSRAQEKETQACVMTYLKVSNFYYILRELLFYGVEFCKALQVIEREIMMIFLSVKTQADSINFSEVLYDQNSYTYVTQNMLSSSTATFIRNRNII